MPTTQQLRSRLVDKLKELFQLNQPDLDFGFYRIMHAKAEQVARFLEDDLLAIIAGAFGEVDDNRKAQLKAEYEKEVETAREYGAAEPQSASKVKEARERYETARNTATAEGEIYDHLYRFFERYYDNGDFIARRYYTRETAGKAAPFAVPYNGEEVKLHWANADQYYIKTAEHFRNFTVDLRQAKEIRALAEADELGLEIGNDNPRLVHFRIVDATEGEHGNVKASEATKRYFIVHKQEPVVLTEDGELVIQFEYRPDPDKSGQENTWRDKRNAEAVETIFDAGWLVVDGKKDNSDPQIKHQTSTLKHFLDLLTVPAPTDKDAKRPLLAKYINQYTARNTMDYFIHKDLGAFLRRELDFYIKNEVMRLDDIESAEAPAVETYLSKLKVLRAIAHKLIDFLAQLEDFQKRLWLKKKFVVETNYCITLDRIPEEFYEEIAANDVQREEWVRLFAINEIEASTVSPGYSEPLTLDFLKAHSHLVLDTGAFPECFTERLCARLDDIDARCEGTLIHSENCQALNSIAAKYRQSVKCVYADPPYNTSEETFVYKNAYRHSSWMTMIAELVLQGLHFHSDDGALLMTIDDAELYHLKEVLSAVYSDTGYVGTIVVQSNPRGRGINAHYATCHEYCLVFAPNPELLSVVDQPLTEDQAAGYRHGEGDEAYRLLPFRRSGGLSTPDQRPNSEFALYYSKSGQRIVGAGGVRSKEYPADYETTEAFRIDQEGNILCVDAEVLNKDDDILQIMPVDSNGQRRVWRWSDRHKILKAAHAGDFIINSKETGFSVQLKDWIKSGRKPKTIWHHSRYDASSHGTNLLAEILGDRRQFGYPKSLYSTRDAIHTIVGDDDNCVCMDPFAGSGTTGHALIDMNREDDGRRKYVLIEMGDYFDTVLKPRIQKVIYSKDWKDGKPVDPSTGISHCFKYIRLESYEDCLNNLVFPEDESRDRAIESNDTLREDYMLHYMLDVETRGSQSLLNIDSFADPTAYKLRVKKPGSDQYVTQSVDLIETFNYLIGLRVTHIAAPQEFTAEFERSQDPKLPDDTQTRLTTKARIKQINHQPSTINHPTWWFRKVEGWVPSDTNNPNNGEQQKVLIVWRKLTGKIEEDNLMLDEWFQRNRISTRDFEFDVICVNGSNNLPNLKQEGDNWKVRLIEEDFMRLMWDVEDV